MSETLGQPRWITEPETRAVLDALEADHDFLLAGDVFTSDLIETWVEMKRADIDAIRLRPHPHGPDLPAEHADAWAHVTKYRPASDQSAGSPQRPGGMLRRV